ncbi:unnamed protein product [Urochloa humidicola]
MAARWRRGSRQRCPSGSACWRWGRDEPTPGGEPLSHAPRARPPAEVGGGGLLPGRSSATTRRRSCLKIHAGSATASWGSSSSLLRVRSPGPRRRGRWPVRCFHRHSHVLLAGARRATCW